MNSLALRTTLQILGVALVVFGGQGAVRLLFDHSNVGLLGWISHSFGVVLGIYVVLVVAGAALAAWASKKED